MLTSFKLLMVFIAGSTMQWMQSGVTTCGFDVSRNKADVTSFDAMRRHFLQAVVDNMEVRFTDQQLLAAGAVSSQSTWPTDEDQLAGMLLNWPGYFKLTRCKLLISFTYSKVIDARWEVYCQF